MRPFSSTILARVKALTAPLRAGGSVFNISRRKVGGIWFVKLGRVNISFCVSRPKSIIETQRMSDTKYREVVRLNEVERALTVRCAELREQGVSMEVNVDH